MDFEHESSASSSSTQLYASSHIINMTHKRSSGRKKFRETRHPLYRGVRQRNGSKWVCEVRVPNNSKSRIWLGTYVTPEMAARAYDVAALALKGKFAQLNFPDSACLLPRPKSLSAIDIRSAAQKAAQPFLPTSSSSSSSSSSISSKLPRVKRGNDFQEISSTMFVDEEAVFNMPTLLASMAEGLLLTPPAMQKGFNWDDMYLDFNMNIDLSLWTD